MRCNTSKPYIRGYNSSQNYLVLVLLVARSIKCELRCAGAESATCVSPNLQIPLVFEWKGHWQKMICEPIFHLSLYLNCKCPFKCLHHLSAQQFESSCRFLNAQTCVSQFCYNFDCLLFTAVNLSGISTTLASAGTSGQGKSLVMAAPIQQQLQRQFIKQRIATQQGQAQQPTQAGQVS